MHRSWLLHQTVNKLVRSTVNERFASPWLDRSIQSDTVDRQLMADIRYYCWRPVWRHKPNQRPGPAPPLRDCSLTSASIPSFFLQTTGTRGRRGHAALFRRRIGLAVLPSGRPTDIKTPPDRGSRHGPLQLWLRLLLLLMAVLPLRDGVLYVYNKAAPFILRKNWYRVNRIRSVITALSWTSSSFADSITDRPWYTTPVHIDRWNCVVSDFAVHVSEIV